MSNRSQTWGEGSIYIKALTHRKKYFNKVYRTVQELGIQAFTEQSSTKFIELFIINMELSIIFPEFSAFYIEKFYKFYKTLFRKCLYPQLLNSSINFTKLFFSVHSNFIFLYCTHTHFFDEDHLLFII